MSECELGRIYDISPKLSERTAVFPGDTAYRRKVELDFAKGDHLTLSSITTSLHIGAHADAPNHYVSGGVGIGARDLSIYLGKCLVLHAKVSRQNAKNVRRVAREHLNPTLLKKLPPRVLLSTGSFPNPDRWNSDFLAIEPELIEFFAAQNVKLIGIDTPSIDPEDSKDLESHNAVAKHDLAILEGLVLTSVPEGLYTLIALPLPLEDADASPVRAILIDQLAL